MLWEIKTGSHGHSIAVRRGRLPWLSPLQLRHSIWRNRVGSRCYPSSPRSRLQVRRGRGQQRLNVYDFCARDDVATWTTTASPTASTFQGDCDSWFRGFT
jgi:hypothetical protein